ncbi:MAG: PAS domain S-box protein [Anaerolineales bacterium]|jgi:PAS domain S-box-containing protein
MNLPTILYFASIVLTFALIGFLAWYWRQQVVRSSRAQVAAAQALLISETRYRRLFEAARDGILILDAESGVVTDVNPFLVEMLGFPRAGIVGKELWELDFFKDIAANKANFLELQQKEYIRYEDLPLETADGRRFHVEFVSNVYQVDHHKVVQCNVRDISERKLAEAKLAQLVAIVESSDDAIIGKTLDGLITSWNAGAGRLYGYSAAEAIGKPVSMLIPEDRPNELSGILAKVKRGERIDHYESVRLSKDGRRLDVSISVSPIKDASGQISGASTIARDITERKRAERSLQEYSLRLETDVAERTQELRDAHEKMIRQERLATLGQLAGSVGHELRNPLGVISNAVYYLKMTQPDANATIRDYLGIIENETRTSDKIITDLLDFTRIKSVDREPADVSYLVHQTLKRYSVPDSVEVMLDLPPDLPPVYADPGHVVQVLGNLVTNAYQAMALPNETPQPGKINLSACQQGDMIAITVQDTGTGIPPENMGKLFEPLFTTKTKGIGLGLAVSQRLIEANGGTIEARSEPGKGSTFIVYLPVYHLQSNSQIIE